MGGKVWVESMWCREHQWANPIVGRAHAASRAPVAANPMADCEKCALEFRELTVVGAPPTGKATWRLWQQPRSLLPGRLGMRPSRRFRP